MLNITSNPAPATKQASPGKPPRIIRGKPATGKPPKIVCTGCGKRTFEAGIAVSETAFEDGRGYGPDGPVLIIDDEDAYPLCEGCTTVLERVRA